MVIKDSLDIEKESDGSGIEAKGLPIASPADRFAAAVIDYLIVLSPFVYLIVAPFQRAMKVSALADDQWGISFAFSLAFIAAAFLIVLYQAICVWRWGATVGKFAMGLRVESVWPTEKINLGQAVTRSFCWLLSCLLLGVPFLAVFANLMRRPMHDRLSDTVVLAVKKEKAVSAPSRHEYSLVRGIYGAFGFCLSVFVLLQAVLTVSSWKREAALIRALEGEDVLCAAVGEAQAEWPEVRGEEAERLNVAMALYAAGQVSRKCLEGEVESLFTAEDESPLLYLAKAFVHADQSDLSDSYLEKVCSMKEQSDECHFSRVVQAISASEWDEVEQKFKALDRADTEPYILIWGVRQFLRQENFQKAQDFVSRLPNMKALGDFVIPAQAKILWGLNKNNEALGVEMAAYSAVNNAAKLDLAGFMCFEQLWSTCDSMNSKSCTQLSALAVELDDGLSDLKTSLAYLRKWECEHKSNINYEPLLAIGLHADVRALVLALKTPGTDGFNHLLDDAAIDEEMTGEVSRRIVERTRSHGLIKLIAEEWTRSRHTLAWRKVGETLFKKYFEMREYGESLKIADVIVSNSLTVSKGLLEAAVVAAVRSGQTNRAKKFFANYAETYPSGSVLAGRSPASSTEFTEAVKHLRDDEP